MSPFPRPDVLLKSFGKAAPLLFVVGMRSTSAEEEKRRGKPRTGADAAGRESMAASAQRQTGRSAPVILPKSAILRNQSKPSSERGVLPDTLGQTLESRRTFPTGKFEYQKKAGRGQMAGSGKHLGGGLRARVR